MKKLIVLLLILTMVFPLALVGCKDDGEKSKGESNKVVLANFEQWGPDFQLMNIYGSFGRVSRNEDTNFVKSGNYSAKLQILGPELSKAMPKMLIPTSSELFEFDYKDFTYYRAVSASLYNADTQPIDVNIGLASAQNKDMLSSIDMQTYTLAPGKWTKIYYVIDVLRLSLICDLTTVTGVYFEFADTDAVYLKDAKTVYLDDVELIKAKEKQEPDYSVITLDVTDTKKEIVDFEKDYQHFITINSLRAGVEESFETSVVKAEDYGINATSGKNVLRVLRHPTQNESLLNQLILPEVLMQRSGIKDIPQTAKDYAEWYFCFDMYNNDTSRSEYMTCRFWKQGMADLWDPLALLANDRTDMGKKKGEFAKWHEGMYAKPGQWTTYSISLYELTKGMTDMDYAKNPGQWALCFFNKSSNGTTDWEMFIDNFRLEKRVDDPRTKIIYEKEGVTQA